MLDIRPRFFSVPGQEVLSAEGITLKVSLAAQYQVIDPYTAHNSADSYHDALYLLLQTALREIAGGLTIDQLLEQRAAIGEQLTARVAPRAEALGLKLIEAGVRDLMLPGELKKIFAQTVKARKEGQAALERARGETAALRHLANAARMAEDNPTLLQLRALQALGDGAGGGNTLVLGLPATAAPIPLRRGEGTSSEQRAEPQSE